MKPAQGFPVADRIQIDKVCKTLNHGALVFWIVDIGNGAIECRYAAENRWPEAVGKVVLAGGEFELL